MELFVTSSYFKDVDPSLFKISVECLADNVAEAASSKVLIDEWHSGEVTAICGELEIKFLWLAVVRTNQGKVDFKFGIDDRTSHLFRCNFKIIDAYGSEVDPDFQRELLEKKVSGMNWENIVAPFIPPF